LTTARFGLQLPIHGLKHSNANLHRGPYLRLNEEARPLDKESREEKRDGTEVYFYQTWRTWKNQ
jgi:hypothetical protein